MSTSSNLTSKLPGTSWRFGLDGATNWKSRYTLAWTEQGTVQNRNQECKVIVQLRRVTQNRQGLSGVIRSERLLTCFYCDGPLLIIYISNQHRSLSAALHRDRSL